MKNKTSICEELFYLLRGANTDPIVNSVILKFQERSFQGIEKYGTTLADNDLFFEEWLTHLQEELMDAVVYIEKIKNELSH